MPDRASGRALQSVLRRAPGGQVLCPQTSHSCHGVEGSALVTGGRVSSGECAAEPALPSALSLGWERA